MGGDPAAAVKNCTGIMSCMSASVPRLSFAPATPATCKCSRCSGSLLTGQGSGHPAAIANQLTDLDLCGSVAEGKPYRRASSSKGRRSHRSVHEPLQSPPPKQLKRRRPGSQQHTHPCPDPSAQPMEQSMQATAKNQCVVPVVVGSIKLHDGEKLVSGILHLGRESLESFTGERASR